MGAPSARAGVRAGTAPGDPGAGRTSIGAGNGGAKSGRAAPVDASSAADGVRSRRSGSSPAASRAFAAAAALGPDSLVVPGGVILGADASGRTTGPTGDERRITSIASICLAC
jgi:hypothetical protein